MKTAKRCQPIQRQPENMKNRFQAAEPFNFHPSRTGGNLGWIFIIFTDAEAQIPSNRISVHTEITYPRKPSCPLPKSCSPSPASPIRFCGITGAETARFSGSPR
ncbi:hypothetical protein GCWU000324_02639 [Kingella oralis ATCC 51147]|uniref:Uncharacterized protein n=1 Tax=Kingella oralis ATCC 51147 TaxID=629741 RepID=C4GLR8_9NEIS|nr:hypothetical protein GCWU000324_02639 [Kingella oralis ATCC 51147]